MEIETSLLPLLARGIAGTEKRECAGKGFEGERGGNALRPMRCAIGRRRVQSDLKKPLW